MTTSGRGVTAFLLLAMLGFPAVASASEPADGAGREYVRENPDHYWRDRNLTWSLQRATPDVSVPGQTAAIASALTTIARSTQLTFTKVDDCATGPGCAEEPDLRIGFWTPATHAGDGQDLTFAGHTFYPGSNDGPSINGDVHFNDGQQWTVTGATAWDIESLTLHEVGHALGLGHATACPSQASPTRPIMCSQILGVQHDLAPDDIRGLQSFYGRPDHVVDGMVRRNSDRAFLGDDLVNTTARGQSITFNRARNQTALFFVRFTNDGSSDDVLRLTAPRAPAGFSYRYYVGTIRGTPATGITTGAGYQTDTLAPNAGITLRVEVFVKPGAVRNRSQGLAVRGTSLRDSSRVDVVRPTVRVT